MKERAAARSARFAAPGRREEWMGNPGDSLTLHAERDEPLDRARSVRDDPVDDPEDLPPEVVAVLRAAREDVVRGEDDGALLGRLAQPAPVELGNP